MCWLGIRNRMRAYLSIFCELFFTISFMSGILSGPSTQTSSPQFSSPWSLVVCWFMVTMLAPGDSTPRLVCDLFLIEWCQCHCAIKARLLEEVGFEDVDIAWRQEAFFVAGGRKRIDKLWNLLIIKILNWIELVWYFRNTIRICKISTLLELCSFQLKFPLQLLWRDLGCWRCW